ncbi:MULTISPECIES: EamA family transporter [unclassified Oceanispirochaeta]|uniref:EamA family transporter n=1 Tax=unclassified Oceanispirochaeta TaxID=2635722 RepID=UPI000E099DE0|nr:MULTISPECIES: EamA family transporter [unclassified Oceanispirochaeta]MBF9018246.1 EamA family transporter [Oceanispirochaeta sp. M2]NPD74715.1 EamA family transporter [Oceanispirochaeta sp. M1]RDG29441.1 multidrug DMT transporter permease [Oceanispirochaeta sp. M1]
MSITAIILILISVGLHAGWNLISKAGKPSPFFFFIVTLSTIALLSPFLLMNLGAIRTIPSRFWLLIIATGFFQTLYYTGLAQAYRHGDISLVYPLIRAIPVLVVPLITSVFSLGTPLSFKALSGLILIGIGCVFMPVKDFRTWQFRNYMNPALFWVFPGALGTVGYTIIDSEAIKLLDVNAFTMPVSLIYSEFINLAIFPWLFLVVIFLSGWKEIKDYKGKKIIAPLIAGLALCLSYMLVLASMKFVSNVSYVAGFRQLSIPLGVILGAVVLKERFYMPRIIGCLIIVVGLIMTALF